MLCVSILSSLTEQERPLEPIGLEKQICDTVLVAAIVFKGKYNVGIYLLIF